MAKTAPAKVTKSPKKETPKAKKLVKKTPAKKPKTAEKPAKVEKAPKEEKPKKQKEARKTSRKVNKKPVLAKTTGINISPAKVKNIVSNHVLNRDAHSALTEIKQARPREAKTITKKDKDGNESTVEVPSSEGTPISQLSESTRNYITFATSEFENTQKDEYAKSVVHSMDATAKAKYNTAKHEAKEAFEKENPTQFLTDKASLFNIHDFNSKYDAKFYAKFKVESDPDSDEWKRAIDMVTKLKEQVQHKIHESSISAFVECLIKQMALNGTICCIAE